MLAYSGELGAAWAYIGHRRSLPPGPERQAIWQILKDEVRHRKVLLALMHRYGARPDAKAEAKLRVVGKTIAFICRVGGWFVPMLGAARLEASNIGEYELLARLAWWAGEPDDVPTHMHLGEVEWDHESVLRGFASRHPLWSLVPGWPDVGPRAGLRDRYTRFVGSPERPRPRKSLLLR